MKKTKRRALYIIAALLGALFVLSCLVGFAACGGGSKDDCADGHTVTSWTTTEEATCTEAGSRTGVCDVCGETVTEPISALGHNYQLDTTADGYVETTTCGGGTNVYVCSRCQDTYTETVNGDGNHTWDAGEVTTAATCTTDGVKTYTCTVCGATYTEPIAKLERLVVPDPKNDELDAAAMKLNSTESFEGYDYTVAKSTTTNENEEEETAYLITGTASAMTDSIVKWYNDGETGAAKAGDSYITLKIFVGIGNTISYTSYGESEKSYTNEDGTGSFDGDYFFVCERLTGVNSDGSQVTTLDGVSYTIKDASGATIEEVDIEFDMTIPWDGESCSEAWYDESMSVGKPTVAITIYSGAELAGLAKLVNEFNFDEHSDADTTMTRHWTVTLAADIDLCNHPWTPIGSGGDHHFDGDFDGAGHTISNLNVDSTDHPAETNGGTGLFGDVSGGVLENVTINNVVSSGRRIVGTLAGNASSYVYDSDGDHHLHIENCHVTGLIQVSGYHQVGGLVGVCEEAYITNCSVEGDAGSYVKSEYAVDQFTDDENNVSEENYDADADDYDGDAAGGLIGYMHTSTGGNGLNNEDSSAKQAAMADFCGITGCTVSGFDISGCRKVGGLIGHNCGSVELSGCTVKDCQIHLVYNSAYSDKIDNNSPRLFVGALVGEFEWLQKVTADCTVSNVDVVYISEDGITGNYTPTAGETNPYAGLFGGSRNQAGYDSSSTPYSQVVYAELTDEPGTYATVKVTDFTLTKSRVTAAAEGDTRLGPFSSTDISVAYDETTKTYIVSGTSIAFGDDVEDFWGSEKASNHTDCEYIAFEIIVGANETLRITTVDADGTTKVFALYGENVTDKTLKGADGSTELKEADGVWIVDVTNEDGHDGSMKMTIEVIGADGTVTETYYVVIGTIASSTVETEAQG